jgi:hypothetical protein
MQNLDSEDVFRRLSERTRASRVILEDGDVFRQLRCSQLAGGTAEAGALRNRLFKDMRKDVSRLYRRHKALGSAFDDLLPFTGLWTNFKLGTFRRILG